MRDMSPAEFLRTYSVRSPHMMWLLGAGASASSGIPTAGDMIWDFKRVIYCAEQRISIRTCEDLHDPRLQQKLQQHIDAAGKYPPRNSEEEYAELFLSAHPNEADRRRYIDRMVSGATPAYGHTVLAILLALNRAHLIWTTNFDKNIEDAVAKVFQTTARLTVASLDSPALAQECIQEGRWPLLVKLHGDFQSRKLKNTANELVKQDELLRQTFVEQCRTQGLVVAGYSGRDTSIMLALEEVVDSGRGFPNGLFWLLRPESPPYKRALDLIAKAQAAGIEAAFVEMNNFDEVMGDILLLEQELPEDLARQLDSSAPRVTDAPFPEVQGGWPVIRLNALPLTSFPTICRVLEADVGGMKDVKELVKASGREIIAVRRKVGVLAFGGDADIRAAFEARKISRWDIHSIDPDRLAFDSMELSLLYEALIRALKRERGLLSFKRQGHFIAAIDPKKADEDQYNGLKNAVGDITGRIVSAGVWWSEGIAIRFDMRQGRLFLVFEPTTAVENLPSRRVSEEVKEHHRKRAAVRYNRKWNNLLDAWSSVLTDDQPIGRLSAFGAGEGIDAIFEFNRRTSFSRRAKAK